MVLTKVLCSSHYYSYTYMSVINYILIFLLHKNPFHQLINKFPLPLTESNCQLITLVPLPFKHPKRPKLQQKIRQPHQGHPPTKFFSTSLPTPELSTPPQ